MHFIFNLIYKYDNTNLKISNIACGTQEQPYFFPFYA